MNIEQAKTIPLDKILAKMDIHPYKTCGDDIWYLSPLCAEKTPSFKINQRINRWFCHSNGIGGNSVDLVVKKFDCTISQALNYLSGSNFSLSFQKQIISPDKAQNRSNEVVVSKIQNIQHIALKQYLNLRNITKTEIRKQLKEIHYSVADKNYFGVGFSNNSGGWELRSKYSKSCIGKKDITLIKNGSITLRVFEGFMDYLSFLQINNETTVANSDYLILNSVTMITKNRAILRDYKFIELYLDNDSTGNKYTQQILGEFKNSVDFRGTYLTHKDLNESIMQQEK
jgi:DNA primase